MVSRPLISIITVNFNNLQGLQRTVSSVVNQTWQDFEYLVVDGGSTDGSKEYLERNSEHIDWLISEPDTGIYNAMNKGIKRAKGEYLLFLNSGDELYNLTVLEKNKDLVHTEDLVYFDIFLIFPGETTVHEYPDYLNFRTFMEGSIGHPTTFIKRKLFEIIGLYDEKLKIVADWKFFVFAVTKFRCSRRKVSTVLSKFYMDGISSTNLKLVDEERQKVILEIFPFELKLYKLENRWRILKRRNKNKYLRWIKKVERLV